MRSTTRSWKETQGVQRNSAMRPQSAKIFSAQVVATANDLEYKLLAVQMTDGVLLHIISVLERGDVRQGAKACAAYDRDPLPTTAGFRITTRCRYGAISRRRQARDGRLASQSGGTRSASTGPPSPALPGPQCVHCLPEFEQGRRSIWSAVNPHSGKRIGEAFPHAIRRRPTIRHGTHEDGRNVERHRRRYDTSLVGTSVAGSHSVSTHFQSERVTLRGRRSGDNGWAVFITTARS